MEFKDVIKRIGILDKICKKVNLTEEAVLYTVVPEAEKYYDELLQMVNPYELVYSVKKLPEVAYAMNIIIPGVDLVETYFKFGFLNLVTTQIANKSQWQSQTWEKVIVESPVTDLASSTQTECFNSLLAYTGVYIAKFFAYQKIQKDISQLEKVLEINKDLIILNAKMEELCKKIKSGMDKPLSNKPQQSVNIENTLGTGLSDNKNESK